MEEENKFKTQSIHLGLFIATLLTTTLAGTEWMGLRDLGWLDKFYQGFEFSIPFLGILTIHEFGHYFTARYYKIKVSLPYYIPLYLPFIGTIGTMGAFIRIKSRIESRKEVFDVGIAGPLAGFVVALFILFYGFTHLPPVEYINKIHPEYQDSIKKYKADYSPHVHNYKFAQLEDSLSFPLKRKGREERMENSVYRFIVNKGWIDDPETYKRQEEYVVMSTGSNLLFMFFEKYVVSDSRLIPNKYEIYHYPFIFAGYLALFFTAFNLIPIGQLDGGHITYGLFGTKNHKRISVSLFIIFVYLAGLGLFQNNFIANAFDSFASLMMFAPLYIYLLYIIFSQVSVNPANNLMIAVSVFAAQFFTEYMYPEVQGFNGWFLFAFVIGRFLGVHHPPALDEAPLSVGRKILGWIALVVFVICFTPRLLDLEVLK
jgi:membrane-associated protease RseP (regulator of RpoE activity)